MVHSLEFEFLDDAQGGPFVAFGGPIAQLRGLLARNDVDTAVRLYEETRGASLELKKSIAVMFKISREAFRRYVAHTPTALRLYRLFSTNLAERVRTLSTLR
jgi:hypothetical protein